MKIQNIHVKNQCRKMVTDAGLAAEHRPGATADFELLCDNLVIHFFGQSPNLSQQRLEAPPSKILASAILQAVVTKYIRVGSHPSSQRSLSPTAAPGHGHLERPKRARVA